MNFSEDRLALRDGIRRMVDKHVVPIAAEIDETDRFPTELLRIHGDTGLMQLWIAGAYSGTEGNLTLMCIAREEISRGARRRLLRHRRPQAMMPLRLRG